MQEILANLLNELLNAECGTMSVKPLMLGAHYASMNCHPQAFLYRLPLEAHEKD